MTINMAEIMVRFCYGLSRFLGVKMGIVVPRIYTKKFKDFSSKIGVPIDRTFMVDFSKKIILIKHPKTLRQFS